MQGYFKAAWNDVKSSPGWFGKMAVLALVGLVPVFGSIVLYGYLLGWARDIAWNVRGPMPARVFGNEDGKLYSRGFFALVIAVVCAIVPWALEGVWGVVTGAGAGLSIAFDSGLSFGFFGVFSTLFFVLITVLSLALVLFSWVGMMRMSVYGRLAPGLQVGRIWAMIRHDMGGLMRIVGMVLLMGLIATVALWALFFAIALIGVLAGFVATGGDLDILAAHMDARLWGVALVAIVVVVFLIVAYAFLAMMASVFMTTILTRALGYWTRQFDVALWRGQDDPMPFELVGAPSGMGGVPGGGASVPGAPGAPGEPADGRPPAGRPPAQW